MDERRRFPRRPVDDSVVSMPGTLTVQVLDISQGGVLLRSRSPVEIGAVGTLDVTLGGKRLAVEVEVRRASAARGKTDMFDVGGRFVNLNGEQGQIVEWLTSQ